MGTEEPKPRVLADGAIQAPDGAIYRRTPTRLKRKLADALVSDGAPIVTSVYPEGLVWHDGPSAARAWHEIRPRLIEAKPPAVRDLQWTGHLWESEAGLALLVFDGAH